MKPTHPPTPFWSTASFGDTTDTSPVELSALGEHLNSCRGAHGRFFGLQCAAEVLNSYIAPRFVTTVVVVTLLIGVTSLAV